MGALASGSRSVAHEACVAFHANKHGVAFENGPLAAVETEPDRFFERIGKQKRPDSRDLHGAAKRIPEVRRYVFLQRNVLPFCPVPGRTLPAGPWYKLKPMDIAGIEVSLVLTHLGKIALAYLLALPIGWNREREAPGAGLRTFPLVAIASCGYVLLGEMAGGDASSRSRIIQGLITGIGFIGGGAILRQGSSVHGTATAASIWNTGVVGAAVAQGHFDIAVLLSAINLITFRVLLPIKQKLDSEAEGKITETEKKPS
jgi:putative Mg2+ transporter-C (MgtC) family protein